jgi:hypothetical protein
MNAIAMPKERRGKETAAAVTDCTKIAALQKIVLPIGNALPSEGP